VSLSVLYPETDGKGRPLPHVPAREAASVACGNQTRDVLALWRKGQVWVYRVQPQGALPDVWGRWKGVVDSVKNAVW
jgi:hypothetical protein